MVLSKVICVLIIVLRVSYTQVYNSLAVMESLLFTQESVVDNIQNYMIFLTDPQQKQIVQSFLNRCETESRLAKEDPIHYLGNPINAFTLFMRLTRDLDAIEKIMKESTQRLAYRQDITYQPDETLVYPLEDDVVGIVQGLTRLQLLYNLDVKSMANGTLTTTFTKNNQPYMEKVSPMTTCDCYELGLVEYNKIDRSRNIAWMKEAYHKYEWRDVEGCPITRVDIIERLIGDYYYMKDLANALYWLEKRVVAHPTDPKNKEYIQMINAIKERLKKTNNVHSKTETPRKIEVYPNLCLKSYYSPNKSLTCMYVHGPHPFLLIAPMKSELLHSTPDILLYHDIITDDEIVEIQTFSMPKLHSAKPSIDDGSDLNYCVHQVAWLPHNMPEASQRVAKRIAQFTGLRINRKTSEEFQVVNYGTGGYYGPHYDFIQLNKTSNAITRSTTVLLYLSDVELGGSTAFRKLGLNVFPMKNAALLWRNVHYNGDFDYNMQHASCPLLRGSRWVMTKWISAAGQKGVETRIGHMVRK